jgi:hypothetical protein
MNFWTGVLVGITLTWFGLLLLGRHINRKRARDIEREYRDLVRVLGK